MSDTKEQLETKKIEVTLNYDHFKKIQHDVSASLNKAQIEAKVMKKYGTLDVLNWKFI